MIVAGNNHFFQRKLQGWLDGFVHEPIAHVLNVVVGRSRWRRHTGIAKISQTIEAVISDTLFFVWRQPAHDNAELKPRLPLRS